MSGPARIAVVGSINVDVVTRAERLPAAGETNHGTSFALELGGKGANQAIAAARLGAEVAMVGRLGDDAFGAFARQHLGNVSGLSLAEVRTLAGQSTGIATIFIDSAGQNAITVIGGANRLLSPADVTAAEPSLATAHALLLQGEIPVETSLAAARLMRQRGGVVILDPAPALADGFPAELLALCDVITPNESEAAILTGIAVVDTESALRAAAALRARGCANVALKMGGNGAFWSTPTENTFIPPFKVTVVDTVAAGDSFNAGLAVALAERINPVGAMRFAAACGALATTRPGASAAAPARSEVETLLRQQV